jgi:hypothetical protein
MPWRNESNHNSNNNAPIPLVYHPLSTRCSSYPKYIMLMNHPTPFPLRCSVLGNQMSRTLITFGCAYKLPTLVNDIADAFCWLLDPYSPIPLCCIYNVIAKLRTCIIGNNHISPFEAHFKLAVFAGCIIARAYFCNEGTYDCVIYPKIKNYLESRWRHDSISSVLFKAALIDLYENKAHLFVSISFLFLSFSYLMALLHKGFFFITDSPLVIKFSYVVFNNVGF